MSKHRVLSLLLCSAFLGSMMTMMSFAKSDDTTASVQTDDQIHYINVNTEESSDAILVESNGKYLMVDTSNPDLSTGGAQAVEDDTANVNGVIDYLNSIGVTHLDYLVMTHSHSDHIGGVTRLCEEGFIDENTTVFYRSNAKTAEEIYYPDWENALYLQRALKALNSVRANVICLADEQITDYELTLGDFSVKFLNLDNDQDGVVDFDHEDENNNSIVLLVTKGDVKTLLAADLEEEKEQEIMDEVGKVDVLKVGHHGSTTSSSYEFLQTLQPETAIITGYQYAQTGAYEYLKSIGTDIYATGLSPDPAIVELVTDDGYEIEGGVEYVKDVEDGWVSWFDQYCYVSGGEVARDGWEQIGHDWYYFNEDGIMQTEPLVEDGHTYYFREGGQLIGRPA